VPEVRVLATGDVPVALLAEIRTLVDAAFEGGFSDDDWAHGLGGRHVVLTEDGRPVAHASVVPRVLEVAGRPLRTGYVESVATAPARQGAGLGTRAMETITRLVREEYELGALSTSAPGFYARLGWERWQGPTYVRACARTFRTADEDDGIMVLRFGVSAAVDLTSPIACEARAGDDW
jgi:aminoglycoside 2'-N-acetyltransferase I